MTQPSPTTMSNEEALRLLKIEPPALSSARSLEEATNILESWQKQELKAAYRTRCKERHPDRGQSEEDRREREQDMRKINLAYRVLKSAGVQDNQRAQHHPVQRMMRAMIQRLPGFGAQIRLHIDGGHIVIVQSSSRTKAPGTPEQNGDP